MNNSGKQYVPYELKLILKIDFIEINRTDNRNIQNNKSFFSKGLSFIFFKSKMTKNKKESPIQLKQNALLFIKLFRKKQNGLIINKHKIIVQYTFFVPLEVSLFIVLFIAMQ